MTDHYTALGLGSAATLADIKKAFRQKASLYHPDRNTSPDAPARFRAVQEAYDVLSTMPSAKPTTTTAAATCWTARKRPPATSGSAISAA